MDNGPHHHHPLVIALLFTVALVVAACGGAADSGAGGSDGSAAGQEAAADPAEVDSVATDPDEGDEAPTGEPEGLADDSAARTESPSDDVPADPASGDSAYIFDQEALHTFELDIDPDLLARIDADPTAEEYVEGALTFEGRTIAPVGIRYKGSVGAFVRCVDGPNLLQPSGAKTCTKLSMKVKINWDDPDAEFFGLRRLQFHSQNLDPSRMRERLGYWLFREMGVPAPRSVHARVVVNGEFLGVFALTEQIDGRFTREVFSDGTGNLYKEVWPVGSDGEPYPEQRYLAALRTNEDDDPSVDVIRSFGRRLADAAPSDRAGVLATAVDVEELVTYVVVDRAIRHDDGPLHFYCGEGGGCTNHNFYWYEHPETAKLHLIAWDLDNAFENIVREANPVTPVADEFGEITNDCEVFPYQAFGFWQRSAVCDPVFGALAEFEDEFARIRTALVEGPLSAERVDEQLDRWAAQIEDALAAEADLHDDAIPVDQWREALDDLRSSLDVARS